MNPTASRQLQNALRKTLGPGILRHGFAGEKRIYRRQRNGLLDIVDVQLWKDNDASRARFTIELGICVPVALAMVAELPSFAYMRSVLGNPGITECTERERLGMLMPTPRDRWWTVSAGTDPEAVASEALATLASHGLPWLETHASLAAFARRELRRPTAFDIALYCHLGLHEEARAAYAIYARQWVSMPKRLDEVAGWLTE